MGFAKWGGSHGKTWLDVEQARTRGRLGVLLAVPLAALVWSASAHAAWLPPISISGTSEHAGVPHVVLDAQGNATAVWEEWDGEDTVVESAYRPAGSGWQTPADLSQASEEPTLIPGEHDAYSPRVAVDARGDTTVVWARFAGVNDLVIQAMYRPADGEWQPPVNLGEMHSAVDPEPRIAVDERGDAIAVWKSDEVIQAAYRPAEEGWEASTDLSGAESFVPQVAMDAQGDATVVWMHQEGSRLVVQSAYRPGSGPWDTSTELSAPGEEGGDPHIALDARGDTIVVWYGTDGGAEVARARYRPAGGSWQAPADVSTPGDEAQSLNVALDADGDAIMVWSNSTRELGGYDGVEAAYRPASGSWQAPEELSAAGESAYPSDVVFDAAGNAAVVWEGSDGPNNIVQADYRPAGGTWQEPTNLSEAGKDATDAVVVLDTPGDSTAADGDATAVWISSEGGCHAPPPGCEAQPSYTVQAAGYDAIESSGGIEAPEVGEVGAPMSISASSRDVWSPLLSFGDGTSASATSATHKYAAPGEYMVKLSSTELLGYRRVAQQRVIILAHTFNPPPAASASKLTPTAPSAGRVPLELKLELARQTLGAVLRAKAIHVVCYMNAPGTCTVRSAFGSGRSTFATAGREIVMVKLSRRALGMMRHLHKLRVLLTAIASEGGHGSVAVSRTLLLR